MRRVIVFLVMAGLFMWQVPVVAAYRMTPRQAVYYHAHAGNVSALEKIKSMGYAVDITDEKGNTALCDSINNQDYPAFVILKKMGATISHPCVSSISPKIVQRFNQGYVDWANALDTNKVVHESNQNISGNPVKENKGNYIKKAPTLFDTIYDLASDENKKELELLKWKVGSLDALNSRGNTPYCQALIDENCQAYETLKDLGVNTHHGCVMRLDSEHQNLSCNKALWWWVGGGVVAGGAVAIIAAASSGGGSKSSPVPVKPSTCPPNSSKTGTGDATSTAGCRCQSGTPRWDGGACMPVCPVGSSPSGAGDTTAVPGCNCNIDVPHWNGSICMAACPAGSSMSGSGDPTGVSGCNCNADTPRWYDGSCIEACPVGSSISGSGDATGVMGCNCNADAPRWYGGACVALCPINSSVGGSGESTTIPGCSCNAGTPRWYDGSCIEACPMGSSTSGIGEVTPVAGCKCNDGTPRWYDGACVPGCPTNSSVDGTGESTTTPGCSCNAGTPRWYDGACVKTCPSGTSADGTGDTTDTPGCKCEAGSPRWYDGACVAACPSGTSADGTGDTTDTPGCKCEAGSPRWYGGACMAGCPTNSSGTGTGEATGVVGCKCNSGTPRWYDGACVEACPSGTSADGTGDVTDTPGCKCEAGLPRWYDGACVAACPSGTSADGTGDTTDTPGCKCEAGSPRWYSGACVEACPTNSSETGTGEATGVSGCSCNSGTPRWYGGACVEACPTGTSVGGAGEAVGSTGCNCDKASWSWNGVACELDCSGSSLSCGANASVKEVAEACACVCNEGFTGDGYTCTFSHCVPGTYESAPGVCTSCPDHSTSVTGAKSVLECYCEAGYTTHIVAGVRQCVKEEDSVTGLIYKLGSVIAGTTYTETGNIEVGAGRVGLLSRRGASIILGEGAKITLGDVDTGTVIGMAGGDADDGTSVKVINKGTIEAESTKGGTYYGMQLDNVNDSSNPSNAKTERKTTTGQLINAGQINFTKSGDTNRTMAGMDGVNVYNLSNGEINITASGGGTQNLYAMRGTNLTNDGTITFNFDGTADSSKYLHSFCGVETLSGDEVNIINNGSINYQLFPDASTGYMNVWGMGSVTDLHSSINNGSITMDSNFGVNQISGAFNITENNGTITLDVERNGAQSTISSSYGENSYWVGVQKNIVGSFTNKGNISVTMDNVVDGFSGNLNNVSDNKSGGLVGVMYKKSTSSVDQFLNWGNIEVNKNSVYNAQVATGVQTSDPLIFENKLGANITVNSYGEGSAIGVRTNNYTDTLSSINSGTITVEKKKSTVSGVTTSGFAAGFYQYGGYSGAIDFLNEGTIDVKSASIGSDSGDDFDSADTYGFYFYTAGGIASEPSTITNTGTINVLSTGTRTDANQRVAGIYVRADDKNVTVTNSGTIDVKANNSNADTSIPVSDRYGSHVYGIYASADDTGSVTITNEATGKIYVTNDTSGKDSAKYDTYGIYAGKNTTIYNNGTIMISGGLSGEKGVTNSDSSTCVGDGCGPLLSTSVSGISMDDTSKIIQKGFLFSDSPLDLTFGYKVALGGTTEATAVSGFVGTDLEALMDNNLISLTMKDAFISPDISGLNVVSDSALFEAKLVSTSDTTHDVVMTMKGFDSVTDNATLAKFLATNYALGNNEAFYNKLKSFGNMSALTDSLNKLTGKDMLSRFNFEDMTMMRELNYDMNEKLFNSKEQHFAVAGSVSPMAFKGDSGSNARYSLYNKRNGNTSIGLGVAFTDIRSDDDHNDNNRSESMYQLVLPLGYKTHGLNLMTSPRIGYARGSYDRTGFDGSSYDGTIEKRVFGLMNEARYPMTVGKWKFEPAAEFNILGYQQKGHEDSKEFALKIQNQNTYSVEGGIGLYATREEDFGDNSTLKLTSGVVAYHEFADPYRLRVGMEGMNGDFTLRDEKRSDNRAVVRAGFNYNKEDLSLYGTLMSYIDKEVRSSAKTGINWKF